jgi:hypothetical protein
MPSSLAKSTGGRDRDTLLLSWMLRYDSGRKFLKCTRTTDPISLYV